MADEKKEILPPDFEVNESDAADVHAALDASEVSGSLKEDIRRVLRRTLKATNGYSLEQKVQAISQGLFDLTRLFAYSIIHESKQKPARTWKDTIVETKNNLTVAVIVTVVVLGTLLILHPEIAMLAKEFAK